ncbi:Y-family DNA polymerase [Psychromonas sp. SP041]|uniref:Y-family DNA polymerase n=1 Tax=Psychromonas sp. SP041 TaxID=1365007 RepID=UPI0010C7BF02|nr:Y-family DNA polymerase [Psychromonas sp. SP041]
MYALIDANSFYCSAEQVFRPEWRCKPIIVLSNNDGCIVAANKQALELGIKKFQPFFKVKSLCEHYGVIVCSSNYELYADLSHKMMQVIGRFGPEQYIYSIDESFLNLNECNKAIPDLMLHGQKIRRAVWKENRLPVCVGIGKTLTLAKVANHVAKKWPGFNGVCVFDDEKLKKEVFEQLCPGDVWGIGRKTNEKLKQNGITNVWQLSKADVKNLPAAGFNVELERTIRELNGIPCKNWDSVRADKKQIFSTRSLGERINDRESLNQALAKHAGIAAEKARKQGLVCSALMVFSANSPFDHNPCSFKFLTQFYPATNNTAHLLKAISENIHLLYRPGVSYHKIGVGLIELSSESHMQWDLFNPPQTNAPLMNVLDKINERYGKDSAFFVAQGTQEKWGMRRDLLTPQYTTNWNHVPIISC